MTVIHIYLKGDNPTYCFGFIKMHLINIWNSYHLYFANFCKKVYKEKEKKRKMVIGFHPFHNISSLDKLCNINDNIIILFKYIISFIIDHFKKGFSNVIFIQITYFFSSRTYIQHARKVACFSKGLANLIEPSTLKQNIQFWNSL